MIRILFICHGNICRSVMAHYIMQDMVNKMGRAEDFFIESAATSNEEIGNPIYPPARKKLNEVGVPIGTHRARRLAKSDYEEYDYLIGMDSENMYYIPRITGGDPEGKIYKLLSFAGLDKDIADPWYTGNFDETYDDIVCGLKAFLEGEK